MNCMILNLIFSQICHLRILFKIKLEKNKWDWHWFHKKSKKCYIEVNLLDNKNINIYLKLCEYIEYLLSSEELKLRIEKIFNGVYLSENLYFEIDWNNFWKTDYAIYTYDAVGYFFKLTTYWFSRSLGWEWKSKTWFLFESSKRSYRKSLWRNRCWY